MDDEDNKNAVVDETPTATPPPSTPTMEPLVVPKDSEENDKKEAEGEKENDDDDVVMAEATATVVNANNDKDKDEQEEEEEKEKEKEDQTEDVVEEEKKDIDDTEDKDKDEKEEEKGQEEEDQKEDKQTKEPVVEEEKEKKTEEEEQHAAPTRSMYGRERKSTTSFDPNAAMYENSKKKELTIEKGNGTPLAEMPIVVENFKKITWSDPNLKALYGIVFGMGKKKEFKTHLFQFNGFAYPNNDNTDTTTTGDDVVGIEAVREKKKEKMYKLKMDQLKAVMDLIDIDRSLDSFDGKKNVDKEMLCSRFLEWLESPKVNSNGKKPASAKKKKRKSASSSSSSPSSATKKKKATTKTTPTKKRKSTSSSTPEGKKTKTKKPASSKKSKKAKDVVTEVVASEEKKTVAVIGCTIPGVSGDKIREKVGQIVSNADKDTLTVKGVRKLMEDWLDTDLSQHKDYIRSLTMEFLS